MTEAIQGSTVVKASTVVLTDVMLKAWSRPMEAWEMAGPAS